MRSKKSIANGARQQCCYDKKGNLITHGKGTGTPDKGAPLSGNHKPWDVKPADLAEELDEKYCGSGWGEFGEKYNQIRPPNKGKNCKENPPLASPVP